MLFAMFMYGLLALAAHGLIDWIDRRIAAKRYEAMWQPAAAPAPSQGVVTIPTAAPPATTPAASSTASSTAPAVAAPPPTPPPSG
jgi:hypothetical protein